MTGETQGPFGDEMYRAQRRLYLPEPSAAPRTHGVEYGGTRKEYEEARDEALLDPDFDFFEHYMPTRRTKHDIGRYALRHGITVPLIKSLNDLGNALRNDSIVIRSDGVEDYTGESGSKTSPRWGFFGGNGETFHHYWWNRQVEPSGLRELDTLISELVLSGRAYPGLGLTHMGVPLSPTAQNSSLWRYIPGNNITILRDPVVEGTYHYRFGNNISTRAVGGANAPDHPQLLQAGGHSFQKMIDAGLVLNSFQEERVTALIDQMIPVGKMIALYEKVRTLPYFDQRQLPTMEMQYDGKRLHFLQYLKTGKMIQDIPEFALPSDSRTAKTTDVVGATAPEGERVRIYLGVTSENGEHVAHLVKDEAVLFSSDIMTTAGSGAGAFMQHIAMNSKIALIDWPLLLHNHHFGSALLVRTPVNVGLRSFDDDTGLSDRLLPLHYAQVSRQRETGRMNDLGYIDAIVTSNGREATVSSDWELRQALEY